MEMLVTESELNYILELQEAKRQLLLAAGQFFIDSEVSLEALWRELGDKITDYNKLLD